MRYWGTMMPSSSGIFLPRIVMVLKFCYSQFIRVYIMPKIPDVILRGSEQLHLFDTPLLLTREYALTIDQRIIKRYIDIIAPCCC